ncbi:ATP-binding protein [Pseudomonas sp. W5-36]|uniref:ATP-binding protein n=1 Tax=Pseudomonas sp. W5-36 TaxID=3097455 RepID=UPI0039798D23
MIMDGFTRFVPREFSGTTKITDKGIRNHFSKTVSPWRPLVELVWNGFDAKARNVTASIISNKLGGVESITVLDDGDGIDVDGSECSFFNFRDSKKKRSHDVHGEKGIGRLYFHKICNKAVWYTKSFETDAKLTVHSDALDKVEATTIPPSSQHALLSGLDSGTCVELTRFSEPYPSHETVAKYLSLEFGWYLAINPSKTITLNGELIIPPEHNSETASLEIDDSQFQVKLINWAEKPTSGKSYIYYTSSKDKVVSYALSSLNQKPGYHTTLAASSAWFDASEAEDDRLHLSFDTLTQTKTWKSLQKQISDFGQEHYKRFLVSKAEEQLKKFEADGELPTYDGAGKAYAEWRLGHLRNILRIILISDPKVFKDSNKKQRKLVIRLLDRLAISNENDAILEVLESVLDLDDSSMQVFSDQIKTAKLNNIISTIEKLQRREEAISRISEIMLHHYKSVLETPDLQGVIEANTWLFGSQYETIGAEETTFTKIAQNLRDKVKGINEVLEEDLEDGSTIAGANKQTDLFLVRRSMQHDSVNNHPYFKCVIIEIKRPSIALNKNHLRQIDDYAGILAKHPSYQGIQTRYEIILLGRKISAVDYDIGERLEQLADRNDPGLAGAGLIKKYVKTWQSIVEEFRLSNHYLLNTLQSQRDGLEETQEELLTNLQAGSN